MPMNTKRLTLELHLRQVLELLHLLIVPPSRSQPLRTQFTPMSRKQDRANQLSSESTTKKDGK